MTINVRQAGFWINVVPDGHLSQLCVERAVEHRVKEVVQPAAGGGLPGFHRPDLGDVNGKFVL